jgi:tetraacyldisaccharide 4'-kinase
VSETAPANHGLIDVLSGARRTCRARLLRAAARCAEPFYTAAVNRRNRQFDRGRRPTHRAHVPVISIGNITTGGTGKTPMVVHVVRTLGGHGHRPAVVLRGYKSTQAGHSDEAELLSAQLPGVPVVVNADRVAAAAQIASEHPEVDVLVLDDAFQHRRIARDLDVVLIDATHPFGFEHVLPRGLLREPLAGLARADAVVITRADQVTADARAAVAQRIEHHHGHPPLAQCTHAWQRALDPADQPVEITNRRVFAFCGLGNPSAFFRQAEAHAEFCGARRFADHHDYTPADVETLAQQAQAQDAEALLTTEKDWVKLRRMDGIDALPLPVWRAQVDIAFTAGGDAFTRRLLAAATRDTETRS